MTLFDTSRLVAHPPGKIRVTATLCLLFLIGVAANATPVLENDQFSHIFGPIQYRQNYVNGCIEVDGRIEIPAECDPNKWGNTREIRAGDHVLTWNDGDTALTYDAIGKLTGGVERQGASSADSDPLTEALGFAVTSMSIAGGRCPGGRLWRPDRLRNPCADSRTQQCPSLASQCDRPGTPPTPHGTS